MRQVGDVRPEYTAEIVPLPVTVTKLEVAPGVTRVARTLTATYETSGDTTVTATIRTAGGRVVRTLVPGVAVPPGPRTIPFEPVDEAGALLSDGSYSVHIESRDPGGGVDVDEAPFVVDASAPTVVLPRVPTRPRTVSRKFVFPISVADVVGIASWTVKVDGRVVYTGKPDKTLLRFVPRPSGWRPGFRQTVTVTAIDTAGNSTSRSSILGIAGQAPCLPRAAGTAYREFRNRTASAWVTCRQATSLVNKAVGSGPAFRAPAFRRVGPWACRLGRVVRPSELQVSRSVRCVNGPQRVTAQYVSSGF